ncbi:SgrR family transcriptional regulator [Vibrio ostreicida]|uniref:SgrR family transcriptional regulator n=1 Tax=Vibrio ostreicida TaxID=526588 RepID=UPI003B5B8BDD
MSDLTLLRYYTRLTSLGTGEAVKVVLPQLAELCCTSPRHARNLLHQMQQHGWLIWTPKVGRNQRSSLQLNLPLDQLKQQLASERVRLGQYQKALLILDNDQAAFGRLLRTTSGASLREGRLHIQLTYKRSFERLVPHQLQRSSERFLLRQIYCCLVSSHRDGTLEPQLAHHWHYDQDTYQWTFYLRPALTFHDGSALDADGIARLFTKLSTLPNYRQELSHLVNITAPMANQIVFQLDKPDFGFGGLISGVKYAIQPMSQLSEKNNLNVIGSGPFKVSEHSQTRLCLDAFEQYYHCRALTDQVTIWKLEEHQLADKKIQTNQPGAQESRECRYYLAAEAGHQTDDDSHQSRIEEGCLFVLFNQTSTAGLNEDQRRYLSSFLSAQRVYQQLSQSQTLFGCEQASNLLPMWQPIVRPNAPATDLPHHITIAVYDYSALKNCAYAIQTMLASLGTEVTVNVYSYRALSELAQNNKLSETLVITNINLDDNRHASAFSSLYHNPVVQHCLGQTLSDWLTHSLNTLRSTTQLKHYLEALEPIASAMITQYWLSPLFHHRQTLRFHGVLKNVQLTNWGWPDIKNVWSTDWPT